MYSTSATTAQVIVHYIGGESEAFNVYTQAEGDTTTEDNGSGAGYGNAVENLRQQIQGLLKQPWIFLQLSEETVCINTQNVTRIAVKPVLFPLQVEGLLGTGERVTALNRTR